jgi:hypothetical protein
LGPVTVTITAHHGLMLRPTSSNIGDWDCSPPWWPFAATYTCISDDTDPAPLRVDAGLRSDRGYISVSASGGNAEPVAANWPSDRP